jgi:hypothetical protein
LPPCGGFTLFPCSLAGPQCDTSLSWTASDPSATASLNSIWRTELARKRFVHACGKAKREALLFEATEVSTRRHPCSLVTQAGDSYLVGRGGFCV